MRDKTYQAALKNLGKRIRKIREAKKLTQLQIEVDSGVNRTDISKIENGKKNIELLTILKIAEALDVEVYEFFSPDK
ncbi:MAG: XRE family transcriptional regulator [Bacteroidetes bacterium]|nr:MAG: XRE family transcriptional regulator [Bacteroidota bacterium]